MSVKTLKRDAWLLIRVNCIYLRGEQQFLYVYSVYTKPNDVVAIYRSNEEVIPSEYKMDW